MSPSTEVPTSPEHHGSGRCSPEALAALRRDGLVHWTPSPTQGFRAVTR
jgi:hypothetical protein